MHIERSFAHVLDCGGMRRTTLRGWQNLNKRYKLAAAFYNLSQLMRQLFGFGTPKQLAAARQRGRSGLFCRWAAVLVWGTTMVQGITSTFHCAWFEFCEFFRDGRKGELAENGVSSTGC
jgi:hypothetical protein